MNHSLILESDPDYIALILEQNRLIIESNFKLMEKLSKPMLITPVEKGVEIE